MHISSPLSSAAPPDPAFEAASIVPAPMSSRPGFEERHLARAFAGFAAAAVSLERSYTQLQSELARLRHELEDRNRALAQSLEENRSLSRHLDGILESLPCGVLLIEADQRISMANPEARRLIAAFCGSPVAGLEPAAPSLEQLIAEARGGATEPGEREYRCAGGREGGGGPADVQWIAARPARLTTCAGQNSVLILILRDITTAKQLEAERERMRCRQALAEMSGLLAHEIRNPLGSLELFAGLLAGWALEEQPRKWAEQLQAGLRFLAATVNNVLDFHSPPPSGRTPTDLGSLLSSMEQFLRPLAQQAGARLELGHDLDGIEVAADRHRLEQVVLNLALNAFRFMPEGGTLRIAGGVYRKGKMWRARVEIADTGCGIPAENLQRIFAPGFTTRAGSPGLGLAVCRAIMRQHGGSITVSSQPGRGSRFALEFPLPDGSQNAGARALRAGA